MLLYKLKKVPWSWHLMTAGICLAITGASAVFSLLLAERRNSGLAAELANFQQQQRTSGAALATRLSFTHQLPSRSKSDDIVKDIGRFAGTTDVQIQSIYVRAREATESEYGSVEFSVVLHGDYKATKAWLSELLARHSTMAVNTMNMRQGTHDASRLESHISLVLYVRN